ncbi:hypothetical protein Q4Q35_16555 [Flavivirga aquimarina]|uniref:Uncharacterized protein n=1 Tax=Flavivirga aquimarina TaxID=2027862 RepID=A0ABT8WE27_9FLAO|nr:hypothetical protein [Flavivirga aquimarina]MDO5971419.1 hypothetical protein [Flavivirga aquimarina]
MKTGTNILTIYATEKGSIKDSVIQKSGKIRAHFIASPELTKITMENHPFSQKIDRDQFSKLCDDFVLKRERKGDVLIKKQSK